MLFRNLMLYQLTQPAGIYFKPLREKLSDRAFHPCSPGQAHSAGFVAPTDGDLMHEQAEVMMLAVQIQEKKIPASALSDLVAEKVSKIEADQERKVYRKERLNIKYEILADKLPSVIPTNKRVYLYIDSKLNMVIVDSGSPGTAELAINLMRECIGSFPAIIPQINNAPAQCMAAWITHDTVPDHFVLGQDCDLFEPGSEGGKVRCRGIDLTSDEVRSHIEAGKQVGMLRLWWDERIGASIKDQGCIKSVKFSDALLAEDEHEDDVSKFDADMAIMVGALRDFIPALGSAFGGWL